MVAQVATVGSNIISEPTGLDGGRFRATNVSFDDKLKAQELKLSEREKLLKSLPWTYLQTLLNSSELKFDFDFSVAENNGGLLSYGRQASSTGATGSNAPSSKPSIAQGEENAGNPTASPAKLSYVIDQNSFVQNLIANNKYAVGNPPALFNFSSAQSIEGKSLDLGLIIDELIDKIKMVKEGEKVSLSIALKPDQLGEMLLSVSMRNGVIFMSITTSSEMKDLIDANKASLEKQLKEANINLGNLDVSSDREKEPFAIWYLFESKDRS